MARVMVTAAGYRGDVLPFVSVARELVARGHEVDLVVPSGFHDSFADEPVALHRLASSARLASCSASTATSGIATAPASAPRT